MHLPARHRWALCRRLEGLRGVPERGATAIEMIFIFAAAVLLMVGVAQLAFWLHARTVAASAAQLGVQASTVQDGDTTRGTTAAQEHITSVGGLRDARVVTRRSNTEVTVTVTASARPLVPFLPMPPIDATASGAVERLTAP